MEMTREEAIKYGTAWLKDEYFDAKDGAFIKKAIEALEQELSVDCISREETKRFLYERIGRLNDDELYDIFSKIIDDMCEELSSVTPQPKIGHWKEQKIDITLVQVCDQCGFRFPVVRIGGYFNYCPGCGAKMQRKGEEFDNLDSMLENLWNEVAK